jgi:hypothetical protein
MTRVRMSGVLAMVGVVAVVGVAFGAKIENGNFEKGNFSGWDTKSSSAAKWKIYDKDHRIVTNPEPKPKLIAGIELPKPIGKFSPFIDMDDQSNGFLSRTIKIPDDARALKLKAFWHNAEGAWVQQGTFAEPGVDDQYFSIDLIKPDAKPSTSSKGDILKNIYAPGKDPIQMRSGTARRGPSGGNYVSDWVPFKAKVKKYRGEKVTLRVAEVSMQNFNFVGIDDVKVK